MHNVHQSIRGVIPPQILERVAAHGGAETRSGGFVPPNGE